MTYLLLDDGFGEHEKIEPLSNHAFRAHVLALLHCAKNLTDGYVSDITLRAIGARVGCSPKKFTVELEQYAVWRVIPGGVMIHDYLEHNPSADEVAAKKKARAEAGRRGGIASGRSRSKNEAVAEAIAEALGSQSVEPHPIPSHAKHVTPAFTSYEGMDAHASEWKPNVWQVILAACDTGPGARQKLNEAYVRRMPSEHRLEQILFAVSQPDTRDPLAKALSMLRKEAA